MSSCEQEESRRRAGGEASGSEPAPLSPLRPALPPCSKDGVVGVSWDTHV